ncbi:hypothetical protein EMPS_03530 [Entomortierella parvispora]|uniref:Uncharacterized protein n=1 Tax=Entomortierella parvispora TaxID=205924 RepID=A0A9P3H702_9FUNG|nr:hypothetical protein EMPS_03530 [Entomortierella parvispora]
MASPQALLWDAFRSDPSAPELFQSDAHIVFLPTGAGAAGEKYVREFYQVGGFSHPKKLAVEETVIHRTVGESSAVDEVEVTVKFVSGAGGWLLPGIEPHHLEDLTVTFPMVICASFAEDRIASVRYVWDNASVLKMVRLIGNRQSWPIVAETQVDALRSPTRFRLNPFGNVTDTSGRRPQTGISKIFQATPPVSPSQDAGPVQQQRKGHPALTSTIFSQYKDAPLETTTSLRTTSIPLSPSTSDESLATRSASSPTPVVNAPVKKGHPALTSTLFNHLKTQRTDDDDDDTYGNRRRVQSSGNDDTALQYQSMATAPAPATKKGHPALTSTVFSHLKQQEQPAQPSNRASRQQEQQLQDEERGAGWRADYVKPKGHPALTSSIFSKAPTAPVAQAPQRTYKKTSHNIFGAPQEPVKAAQQPEKTQEETQVVAEEYVLEPSVIEAELERHQQQQEELKAATLSDEHEAELRALEKLAIQQEQANEEQAQEEQEQKRIEEQLLSEPVSPTPTAPATAAFTRKIHPNYRTSFTIGGPR